MEFKNYVLKNRNDLEVHVTNYGGIITRILTKDKAGKTGDIAFTTIGATAGDTYSIVLEMVKSYAD